MNKIDGEKSSKLEKSWLIIATAAIGDWYYIWYHVHVKTRIPYNFCPWKPQNGIFSNLTLFPRLLKKLRCSHFLWYSRRKCKVGENALLGLSKPELVRNRTTRKLCLAHSPVRSAFLSHHVITIETYIQWHHASRFFETAKSHLKSFGYKQFGLQHLYYHIAWHIHLQLQVLKQTSIYLSWLHCFGWSRGEGRKVGVQPRLQFSPLIFTALTSWNRKRGWQHSQPASQLVSWSVSQPVSRLGSETILYSLTWHGHVAVSSN